jgi:hypoxanthine phosphoribosyltransferase
MHDFPTLIDRATIERRIEEIAGEIRRDHPAAPPVLVAVMEGARVFATHLARRLPDDGLDALPFHAIRASSYGAGTASSGVPLVTGGDGIPVRGQDLLLVEDIVDTGRTVATLKEHFLARGARSVAVVTLLSKPARRLVEVELRYVGFAIPDAFVVGFGMDHAGRYRDLDRIALLARPDET